MTLKHFYHIRCDADLDEVFYAMRRMPCACTGCVEQFSNPSLPNVDKNLQPRYAILTETWKYSSIFRGYIQRYISELTKKKKQETQMRWRLKTSLS